MNTLSIHPIEYLRVHTHYEGVLTRGLESLVKKAIKLSDQAATIAVVLLTVGLVIFGCMKIVQSASIAASYDAAITEMYLPPLQQVIPTAM